MNHHFLIISIDVIIYVLEVIYIHRLYMVEIQDNGMSDTFS